MQVKGHNFKNKHPGPGKLLADSQKRQKTDVLCHIQLCAVCRRHERLSRLVVRNSDNGAKSESYKNVKKSAEMKTL